MITYTKSYISNLKFIFTMHVFVNFPENTILQNFSNIVLMYVHAVCDRTMKFLLLTLDGLIWYKNYSERKLFFSSMLWSIVNFFQVNGLIQHTSTFTFIIFSAKLAYSCPVSFRHDNISNIIPIDLIFAILLSILKISFQIKICIF